MTGIYDEPKIDCHNHVFDPVRFPYIADAIYRPAGQEIGTAAQLLRVLDAYGVRYALVVGPTSGYAADSRCLLDAIAHSDGRFKGVAVVPLDAGRAELERLKAAGIVGIAVIPAMNGLAYYADAAGLFRQAAALDLFVQVQTEGDQLASLAPMLEASGARILIDHCGRPTPEAGLDQAGFRTLLGLARSGRAFVKLSGQMRFSRESYPFADSRPYIRALIEAFTPDACMWGSDWPFVRATERVDYGPLLKLLEALLPDAADRRRVLWDTPRRLFGFGT
jgi:predicted TIM-barrel fold metal-dependent hydrolase